MITIHVTRRIVIKAAILLFSDLLNKILNIKRYTGPKSTAKARARTIGVRNGRKIKTVRTAIDSSNPVKKWWDEFGNML